MLRHGYNSSAGNHYHDLARTLNTPHQDLLDVRRAARSRDQHHRADLLRRAREHAEQFVGPGENAVYLPRKFRLGAGSYGRTVMRRSTGVGARREQRQRQESGYLTKTGRHLPAVAANLAMIKDHHQGIG